MMTMKVLGTHSLERTLEEMRLRLGVELGWRSEADVPSASAFCQARRKFDQTRCVIGILQEVKDFIAAGSSEQVLDLETSDEHDRPLADRPTIRVRLLRAPLPDGGFALYLTTLLDPQLHSAQTLIELYSQRICPGPPV